VGGAQRARSSGSRNRCAVTKAEAGLPGRPRITCDWCARAAADEDRLARLDPDPPEIDAGAHGFEGGAHEVVIADRGAAAGDHDVGLARGVERAASASRRSGTGRYG
jgi:hypothetical protein